MSSMSDLIRASSFIVCLRPSCLPGSGTLLSSYLGLEVALYTIDRQIDGSSFAFTVIDIRPKDRTGSVVWKTFMKQTALQR